ncbi:hypothetical protein JCM19231_4495 [Vibrio ishigakensis]|uniref:Uncharacterized protein n=1 Tax=Vibrio ishigakensis TaxID=1481914 RepID=A0A0B8NVI3_9VIBR|nr:hypothetical protein JCM19231_4495 [Vibrio ishigakensis]
MLNTAVNSAPYFAADVKASLSVPSFYDVFDVEANEFKDPEMGEKVKQTVETLIGELV